MHGRNRHLLVATAGNRLTVDGPPADVPDRDGAHGGLVEPPARGPAVTAAWADQRYAGDRVAWAAKPLGITSAIVKRPSDQGGCPVLPRRWLVERPSAWVHRCRRVRKDFAPHPRNSAAGIYGASIHHMLRQVAPPTNQERPYARTKGALAP